jgi:hypothetical protein
MFPVSTGIKLHTLVHERNVFPSKKRGAYWQAVVWVQNVCRNLISFVENVSKSVLIFMVSHDVPSSKVELCDYLILS